MESKNKQSTLSRRKVRKIGEHTITEGLNESYIATFNCTDKGAGKIRTRLFNSSLVGTEKDQTDISRMERNK